MHKFRERSPSRWGDWRERPLGNEKDAPAKPRSLEGLRSQGYLIASAFGGEATPPSLLSGAEVKKNS
jgi:hypothetical protein